MTAHIVRRNIEDFVKMYLSIHFYQRSSFFIRHGGAAVNVRRFTAADQNHIKAGKRAAMNFLRQLAGLGSLMQILRLHIHALPIAVQNAGVKGLAPVPAGVLPMDVFAQPSGLAMEDLIQRP